jgi:hypothetical protein
VREKIGCDFVRLPHRLALARGRTGLVTLGNRDSVFPRQRSHRLGKREPFHLHDEIESAAARAASKAMEESAFGIDRK